MANNGTGIQQEDDFMPDSDMDDDDFSIEPFHEDPARDFLEKGLHAYKNGDIERARGLLNEALKLRPDFTEAKNVLEKQSFSKEGPSRNPQTLEGYRQGLQQYLGGDINKAKSIWGDVLRSDPMAFEAREGLQRIAERSGR